MTIEEKPIPSILYRYRGLGESANQEKYVKPIFVRHELYYPSRIQMNDPFECTVPGFESVPKHILHETTQKRVDRLLKPHGANRKQRRGVTIQWQKKGKLQQVRDDVQRHVDRFGILCLSQRREDLLMWSHYANGHRGLCLGFEGMARALRVHYCDARPDRDSTNSGLTFAEKVVLTKSKHWSYECEWRVIETRGKGVHTFRPEALKEVIFGCRATDSDKERVRDWIKVGGLTPALYQAKTDSREFKVHICPVT